MFHVFIILFGVALTFAITYGSLFLQKKISEKNATTFSSNQYLAADLILFLFLTLTCMLSIISLVTHEFKKEPWLSLNDSGLLLAIALLFVGKFVYYLYSLIARKFAFNDYKEGRFIVYLLACLILFFILLRLQYTQYAMSIAAIIIGRFAWFDTTWEKVKNDFVDLFHILIGMPFGTLLCVVLIVIAVIIGNEYFIGIVFWGSTCAFISFSLYVHHLSKRNFD